MDNQIDFILSQFNIEKPKEVVDIKTGIINRSFFVTDSLNNRFVLQNLHKIFSSALLDDYESITNYLSNSGIKTPLLISTRSGDPYLNHNNSIWRLITFIPGITLDSFTPKLAKSAGAIVGKFHNLLSNYEYDFKHKLEGFHDFDWVIDKLIKIDKKYSGNEKHKSLRDLTAELFERSEKIKGAIHNLPDRIIHGDLKLTNIRFDEAGENAVCLIDLDTLSKNKIVIDLGDAVRSWCRTEDGEFDIEIFNSLFEGYFSEAKFLTIEEKKGIFPGVETVILELSARYIIDAYEENYFLLDESKYSNLFEQNSDKAKKLLDFHESFLENRKNAENSLKHYI